MAEKSASFGKFGTSLCSRKIRILLSGLGLMGKRHAEIVARSNNSILCAAVGPVNPENIEVATAFGVSLFESIQDAVENVAIDAAIIASPNQYHLEQALFCIEKQIPILVEKPLAANLKDARDIFIAASTTDVPVLVGHHRTYNKLLTTAKEFINSKEFGSLVAVQGSALFRKPEQYFVEGPWRTRLGGGPILINLIHEIGIMRFLCGPIYSVAAIDSNAQRRFEVEDTVAMALKFENGALGTFVLSDVAGSEKSWELSTGENSAYPQSFSAECYHFAGTNGSLDFPTMSAKFFDKHVTPSWWNQLTEVTLSREAGSPLDKQFEHFEEVILRNEVPLVSAADGLENIRVLDAIRHAILQKKEIHLGQIIA